LFLKYSQIYFLDIFGNNLGINKTAGELLMIAKEDLVKDVDDDILFVICIC
jgi:hypothetical protein